MTLVPGARFGPYEVLGALGAGGMGDVYRARDTRLERTVALKVLPASFVADPARRLRFEREAKAISALNHPHICTIHDVGQDDGTDYLVMELVEGQSLAHRLARGPLSVDETLRAGEEIARALAAAHAKGIVHRDLKPANVMLTKAGIKLLDFGLARVLSPGGREAETLSALDTQAKLLTREGTILGTLPYMAPEQLEGKEADARSDIWSLGAVLYEMATGRRPFAGDSQASLIASILEKEPAPINRWQPLTPEGLDRITRSCLAKDPAGRWQSAQDVATCLRWVAEGSAEPRAGPKRAAGKWIAGAAILAVALAVTAAVLMTQRAPTARRPTYRFQVAGPGGDDASGYEELALSPDGRHLAFIASQKGGDALWIRALDALEARPVPDSAAAAQPFWSPDGRHVGFVANGVLKRADVSGGSPRSLAGIQGQFTGASWTTEGWILYAVMARSAGEEPATWHRIPAAGGEPARMAPFVDDAGRTVFGGKPHLLPGGHVVFLGNVPGPGLLPRLADGSPRVEALHTYVGSLETGRAKILGPATSKVAYSAGHLLAVREGILYAQAFDEQALRTTGEPTPVVDGVKYFRPTYDAAFSASADGTLAYVPSQSVSRLVWLDRSGREVGTSGSPAAYERNLRLSPDGRKLAVLVSHASLGTPDIWIHERGREAPTRFTSSALSEFSPTWSPDGRQIAFSADWGAPPFLHVQTVGGGEPTVLLAADGAVVHPNDWSPDGRQIVFSRNDHAQTDLWLLPMDGERTPVPLVRTRFNEYQARISPDGRRLAFTSDESGRAEIYVQSFPQGGDRQRVSTAGGSGPRWSSDVELLYVSAARDVLSVPLARGMDAGKPQRLFHLESLVNVAYDVARGGQELVANVAVGGGAPIVVVTSFADELKRRD